MHDVLIRGGLFAASENSAGQSGRWQLLSTILVTQTLGSSSSEKMVSQDHDPARYQCRSSQLDFRHHDIYDLSAVFCSALFEEGADPFGAESFSPKIFVLNNPMPQLSCPQCDQKITVAISQAGSKATCPSCQREVSIPTLRELRRLPDPAESPDPAQSQQPSESTTGRRIVFAILMLIAGTAGIAGLFSAVRYIAIEVPATTETHIAEIERVYQQVPGSQLVREWQQMEKVGLDSSAPYNYKRMAIEKARWGRNGLIGLCVFAMSVIVATMLGIHDSRQKIRDSKSTPRLGHLGGCQ